MSRQVLFLCTANMYRSRLAEVLFNYYASGCGLDWRADSRAITDPKGLSGMSSLAAAYLDSRGLGHLALEPRDPVRLGVEELESADMAIAMCRQEHEPLLVNTFGGLARRRILENRLRFWNVYDSRLRLPFPLGLIALFGEPQTQHPASGTEHIDFAVRALVNELVDAAV